MCRDINRKSFILKTFAVLCLFVFNFHRHLREHAMVSTALTLSADAFVEFTKMLLFSKRTTSLRLTDAAVKFKARK